MIIHDEQQSTARSCGRQSDKFARLEKGSLIATPGLSERYPQESPKCPASSAKRPGDKAFYHSAMSTGTFLLAAGRDHDGCGSQV
jgi:hypothetical protein